jgi:hypothetical protein
MEKEEMMLDQCAQAGKHMAIPFDMKSNARD